MTVPVEPVNTSQALATMPQLADGLSPLGSQSAENLHSVCDMCVANLGQLGSAAAGPEVAEGLTGGRLRTLHNMHSGMLAFSLASCSWT